MAVAGFARTDDGHNHRQGATVARLGTRACGVLIAACDPMSCPIHVFRHLAEMAAGRGAEVIRFRWAPSERNDAACHFFTGIPGSAFVEDEVVAADAALSAGVGPDPEPEPEPASREPAAQTPHELAAGPDFNWEAFMTPELEALSQRQRKKELRRRVRNAQKGDSAFQDAKKAARRTKRLNAKVHKEPGVEQVSQHRPFGNKPHPGHVTVPTAAAHKLSVAVTGSGHRTEGPASVGSGDTAPNQRVARRTTGGRLVALHHETTLSVGRGLSDCTQALSVRQR